MNDLFVYGTLMPGQVQGGLLKRYEHVEATTRGTLWRLAAGYPALELSGDGRVHGQLVRGVDPRLLGLLDQYEGVDEGLYRRVPIDVDVGLRSFGALAYVMDDPERRGGVRIPRGRWKGALRR